MSNPKYHEFEHSHGLASPYCTKIGCQQVRDAPVHTRPTGEQDDKQEAVNAAQDSSVPRDEKAPRSADADVELLPCPFCGGKAGYTPPFKVGTPSVGGKQLIEPARAFCLSEKCIRIANMPPEQWNTRTPPVPPANEQKVEAGRLSGLARQAKWRAEQNTVPPVNDVREDEKQ